MSQEYLDFEDFKNVLKAAGLSILAVWVFVFVTGTFFIGDFMEKIKPQVIYPIIATLVSLGFFIALYIRGRTVNLWSIRYLLVFSALIVLFNFLQILQWDIAYSETPYQRPLGYRILNLADLSISIFSLALFLHFVNIEQESVSSLFLISIGILIFPLVFLNTIVFLWQDTIVNASMGVLLPLFAISALVIIFYGLRVNTRIYFNANEGPIKAGALTMIASLIFFAFSFTTQIFTDDVIDYGFVVGDIHQLLLFSFACSMLAYTYIKNPLFLYAVPFKLYEIIIYDSDGNALYFHTFGEVEETDADLKVTGLQAIGGMLKEISGFRGEVEQVNLTDGRLVIKNYDIFSVCLITEVRSPQIKDAVKDFGLHLKLNFDKEQMNKENILPLINKYFPYSS